LTVRPYFAGSAQSVCRKSWSVFGFVVILSSSFVALSRYTP
jgi:hypothetical protein